MLAEPAGDPFRGDRGGEVGVAEDQQRGRADGEVGVVAAGGGGAATAGRVVRRGQGPERDVAVQACGDVFGEPAGDHGEPDAGDVDPGRGVQVGVAGADVVAGPGAELQPFRGGHGPVLGVLQPGGFAGEPFEQGGRGPGVEPEFVGDVLGDPRGGAEGPGGDAGCDAAAGAGRRRELVDHLGDPGELGVVR